MSRRRAQGAVITVEGLEELGASLDNFAKRLPKAIQGALRGEFGTYLRDKLRERSPRRTGTLRDGIDVHEESGAVLVGYQGELAGGAVANAREQRGAWVESGTRPHKIRARDGGSLLIAGGGRVVEEVDHPGTRGQGVMRKTLRLASTRKAAERAVADELEKIDGAKRV